MATHISIVADDPAKRRKDLPETAQALLRDLAVDSGAGISAEALSFLATQDWHGNIGDLERALLRAVMLGEGGDLMPQDFQHLFADPAARPDAARANGAVPPAPHAGVADQEQLFGEGALPPSIRTDRQIFARYGLARLLDERGEMRPIGALEEEVIRFAIGHYDGHMSEVARRLGIGRSTLYRKLRDYGIAPGEPVAS